MKKILLIVFAFNSLCSIAQTSCQKNVDFESGFSDWKITTKLAPYCSSDCFIEGPILGNHTITTGNGTDPYGGFPQVAPGGNNSLKIGNTLKTDRNQYTAWYNNFYVTDENKLLGVRVAGVLEDVGEGGSYPDLVKPSINIDVGYSESNLPCGKYVISADYWPGMTKVPGQNIYYIPWTTLFVDLSEFVGSNIWINFRVEKGGYIDITQEDYHNLFAYAYFDNYCTAPSIEITGDPCINSPVQFSADFTTAIPGETFTWNMGDGTILEDGKHVSHTYKTSGPYTVTLNYNPNLYHYEVAPPGCGAGAITQTINVSECAPPFVCEDCIPSFSPLPGQKYILTAWVREGDGIGYTTYENASIRLDFGQGTVSDHLRPSGLIIDGWQRIEAEFTVPDDAESISVQLRNDNNPEEAFFDDIRVQPFNASMKSFVYDPVTLRLVSELDERGYATFFEYDEEGALIRVKKETERGVKTVRESRESLRKRNP